MIETHDYMPQLLGIYTFILPFVRVKLMLQEGRVVCVPLEGAKLVWNGRPTPLPKVEECPYYGENWFGETSYCDSVVEEEDGSLTVHYKVVGNYSMYYTGKRGEDFTLTLPAWYVRAYKECLEKGEVEVKMWNDCVK